MNVSEITANMKKVDLIGTIATIAEPRTVNLKTGGTTEVADAIVQDASGSITVPIWGADIAKFRKGDRVEIKNGYSTSYKDKLQVSIGKYGKITLL